MRIAILGTRGVPAAYGGFETFAEEVSKEFIKAGHEVTVYGRRPFLVKYTGPTEHQGIKIRIVPTIMHKYLETPLSSLTSFLDLYFCKFDVILLCNAANSPFCWLGRLRGLPLLINVDGIERNRSKWNSFGKLWYRLGELSSVLFANRIISDADVIADYYKSKYKTESAVIRYGAKVEEVEPGEILGNFNLKKDNYILYVSRLEPENNALGVIQAYSKLKTEVPLVVVGDAPYAEEYKASLRSAANQNVIFTGFQFGAAYKELRTNCKFYIQATEVGGTHPALVEAICYGNCVIANDVPEHREVLLDSGIYYEKNNFDMLAEKMQDLLVSESKISELKAKALSRRREFSWEAIARQYLFEFEKLTS